jgi:hypothetical protein
MASCRAGPGGMLRAISMARSAFASQWVFEPEFFLVKKRPHIVNAPKLILESRSEAAVVDEGICVTA